jgi:hypothetical protein
LPAYKGLKPDKWQDLFEFNALLFPKWIDRQEKCPGKAPPIIDTDRPLLGKDPKLTIVRKLEFWIIVRSTPGCECKKEKIEVRAVQVLKMVKGKPVWAGSYFLPIEALIFFSIIPF